MMVFMFFRCRLGIMVIGNIDEIVKLTPRQAELILFFILRALTSVHEPDNDVGGVLQIATNLFYRERSGDSNPYHYLLTLLLFLKHCGMPSLCEVFLEVCKCVAPTTWKILSCSGEYITLPVLRILSFKKGRRSCWPKFILSLAYI